MTTSAGLEDAEGGDLGSATGNDVLRAQARLLLAQMLGQISHYRDTPLSFDLDNGAIAAESWQRFTAEIMASGCEAPPEWQTLALVMNDMLIHLLDEAAGDLAVSSQAEMRAADADAARWVARLQKAARGADAQGAQILQQLNEGFPCRDVARRLDLGLRFTRRIAAETAKRWRSGNT